MSKRGFGDSFDKVLCSKSLGRNRSMAAPAAPGRPWTGFDLNWCATMVYQNCPQDQDPQNPSTSWLRSSIPSIGTLLIVLTKQLAMSQCLSPMPPDASNTSATASAGSCTS